MRTISKIAVVVALQTASVLAWDLKLETTVQPELVLEQKGDFATEGESSIGFNRARVGLRFSEELSNIVVKSRLSFDLTEENLEESIKNAYVQFDFFPQFELTLGRKKGIFGYENRVSSSDLPLVFRSETSSHLKNELGVSGFLDGVTLSGELSSIPLSYSGSFTRSENDQRDGLHFDRLFSQTALSLSYEPIDSLSVTYSANISQVGVSVLGNSDSTDIFLLHEAGVTYHAPKWYTGMVTCFWGIDTTSARELSPLLTNYEENISLSLYTSHEMKIPLNDDLSLDVALGGEFLNGLNYYDGAYHDRSFNYVGYGALGVSIGDHVRFQTAVKEKFDSDFSSINDMEIAVQCSYFGSWKK